MQAQGPLTKTNSNGLNVEVEPVPQTTEGIPTMDKTTMDISDEELFIIRHGPLEEAMRVLNSHFTSNKWHNVTKKMCIKNPVKLCELEKKLSDYEDDVEMYAYFDEAQLYPVLLEFENDTYMFYMNKEIFNLAMGALVSAILEDTPIEDIIKYEACRDKIKYELIERLMEQQTPDCDRRTYTRQAENAIDIFMSVYGLMNELNIIEVIDLINNVFNQAEGETIIISAVRH